MVLELSIQMGTGQQPKMVAITHACLSPAVAYPE